MSAFKMGYLGLICTLSLILGCSFLHAEARKLQSQTQKPIEEENATTGESRNDQNAGKMMIENQQSTKAKLDLGETKNVPPIPEVPAPQLPGNVPFAPQLPNPQTPLIPGIGNVPFSPQLPIPQTPQTPGNIPFLPPSFPLPQIPPPLGIPNFPLLPPFTPFQFPPLPNFPPLPPFGPFQFPPLPNYFPPLPPFNPNIPWLSPPPA